MMMGRSESGFRRPKTQNTFSCFYFIGQKPRFLSVIEDPLTGF
jgi:hypothetical protein